MEKTGKYDWKYKTKKEKRNCQGCSKSYFRTGQNQKFCSLFCRIKYKKENYPNKCKEEQIKYDKTKYKKHKKEIIKRIKRYRHNNLEKMKQRAKKSYKKNKEYYNKKNKEWIKNNPEKRKAIIIANNNIRIPKNQICILCKKRKATIKHHKDYSKPLEVKFVCAICHKGTIHGKN